MTQQQKIKTIQSKKVRSQPERLEIEPYIPRPITKNSEGIQPSDLPELHFIGTFHKKVIVTFCQRLNCLVFLDQHAVHERIRFECYLQKAKKQVNIATQNYFKDVEVRAIEPQRQILRNVVKLRKVLLPVDRVSLQIQNIWGFQFQTIGCQQYMVTCPDIFQHALSEEQLRECLPLSHRMPVPIRNFIASTSCKAAIKFNDEITQEMALLLLRTLKRCRQPFICVHGRNLIHLVQTL